MYVMSEVDGNCGRFLRTQNKTTPFSMCFINLMRVAQLG